MRAIGLHLPNIADLVNLPGQDVTYFFRKEIEEERRLNRVRAPLDPEGISGKRLDILARQLSGDYDIRFVLGASIYKNGKSKYEASLLGNKNFPHSAKQHEVDMLSNEFVAREAERHLVVKLAEMGIPADIKTNVVHYKDNGYVVHARLIPDRRLDAGTCKRILQEYMKIYGVNPRQVVH